MPVITPFWTFWACVASLVALVLSQLPPIHSLLKPRTSTWRYIAAFRSLTRLEIPICPFMWALATQEAGSCESLPDVGAWSRRQATLFPTCAELLPGTGRPNRCLVHSVLTQTQRTMSHSVTFLNFFDRPTEKRLRKHVEDYQYGGGIHFNVDRHAGVFVPISEDVG